MRRWVVSALAFVTLLGPGAACGGGGTSDLNDTWTWDGKDWSQVQTSPAPPWRTDAIFVYDEASNTVLLFGGLSTSEILGDTWAFDGRHWTQQHPEDGPSARFGAVAAYDPIGRHVIMFGGRSQLGGQDNDLAETWTWTDSGWRLLQPTTSPPTSSIWNDLLFDPTKNRLTLFGGHVVSNTWVPETWVWENSNWKEVPSTIPSPWADTLPVLIQYGERRVSILYTDLSAGVISSVPFRQQLSAGHGPSPVAETWNGSSWVGDRPEVWMPATAGGGYSFFPPKRYLVTFGGDTCVSASSQMIYADGETWSWDGTVWNHLQPRTNPPARSVTYLAYATAQSRVVMFGGYVQGSCRSLI
jgi:hypothetical protein